ncbi:hypothetical protein [Alteromonas sp. OM2203]|uniref:hypothetical protein n=1 Tax=Alteromonas sp. OM2203 TaxID=3398817 RepID=UPI003AF3623E
MNNPLAGTDPTGYIGCAEGDTCTETTTTKNHYETKTGSRIKTKTGSTTTTTTTNQNGDTVNITSSTVMNNGNFQTSSVSYDNGAVSQVSASKGNFNTGDMVGATADLQSQGNIAKGSGDAGANITFSSNWCHGGSCRTGVPTNIDARSISAIDQGLEELNSYMSMAAGAFSLPSIVKSFFTKGAKALADDVPTSVHKNSRSYEGETHVYAIRSPDGSVNKIGESAQGVRIRDGASKRAEQQVRRLNREVGPGHTSEIRNIFPNKNAARNYETRLIERYRRMYGQDTLPGNKTNR